MRLASGKCWQSRKVKKRPAVASRAASQVMLTATYYVSCLWLLLAEGTSKKATTAVTTRCFKSATTTDYRSL